MADREETRERLYQRFVRKLLVSSDRLTVTDDEVEYFRAHPDEIDDFSAPVAVHRVFLVVGISIGVGMVVAGKVLKATTLLAMLSSLVEEIIVDLVFEVGVALIGASVTAYLLGMLMNAQQQNAHAWRVELNTRIAAAEAADGEAADGDPG